MAKGSLKFPTLEKLAIVRDENPWYDVRTAYIVVAWSQGGEFAYSDSGGGMNLSMNVAEHWTSSRRALVVTADTATVRNLVQELELSQDVAVRVNQNRLAIALWGEDLKSYIRYRDSVLNADASQTASVPEYVTA